MMDKNPTISVGIMQRISVSFSLTGNYMETHSQTAFKAGRYSCLIDGGRLVTMLDDSLHHTGKELCLIPKDPSRDIFGIEAVTIGINFHWEQKENQRFQGILKLVPEGEMICVINVLPLEDYLISVISSEMNAKSSIEFLKAHAVISRSWLLAQIEKKGTVSPSYQSTIHMENERVRWYDREDHHLFDVCADDHCQRYQGITKASNTNVKDAVMETKGVVLCFEEEICDARFSKCCGGMTERFESCWEPRPRAYLSAIPDSKGDRSSSGPDLTGEEEAHKWIRSRPEAFCNTSDKEILSQVLNQFDLSSKDFYRWQVRYSQKEISDLIRKKSGMNFGAIIDLTPLERGPSGRIIRLCITGSNMRFVIGKELEIRRWLSHTHLYSSAFVVHRENVKKGGIPESFIIDGAGWGHGVGLCQIGAAVMGHRGYTHADILGHYFRGALLVKRYR